MHYTTVDLFKRSPTNTLPDLFVRRSVSLVCLLLGISLFLIWLPVAHSAVLIINFGGVYEADYPTVKLGNARAGLCDSAPYILEGTASNTFGLGFRSPPTLDAFPCDVSALHAINISVSGETSFFQGNKVNTTWGVGL